MPRKPRYTEDSKILAAAVLRSLQARREAPGISPAMAAENAETIVLTIKHISYDQEARADAVRMLNGQLGQIGFAIISTKIFQKKGPKVPNEINEDDLDAVCELLEIDDIDTGSLRRGKKYRITDDQI